MINDKERKDFLRSMVSERYLSIITKCDDLFKNCREDSVRSNVDFVLGFLMTLYNSTKWFSISDLWSFVGFLEKIDNRLNHPENLSYIRSVIEKKATVAS